MKKIDLGQTIQIVANVGVIAGIVFLGIELQQNNEFLAAEARAARTASRQGNAELIIGNPDLQVAIAKTAAHERLTFVENLLMRNYFAYAFTGWQYSWGEYDAGLIGLDSIPVDGWRVQLRDFPGASEYWQEERSTFRPDFVRWMEDNVEDW